MHHHKEKTDGTRIYTTLLRARKLLSIARIRPIQVIVLLFLMLAVALFEAATMFFLVPILKIVFESNSTSTYSIKIAGNLLASIKGHYLLSDGQFVIVLGLMAFVSVILKNIFEYVSLVKANIIARTFETDLRKSIYKRYLSFGKLYFDENNSGTLYETLIGYVSAVSLVLLECFNMLFFMAVLSAYLIVMIFISWQLALICPILLVVIYAIFRGLLKTISRSSKSYVEHYSALCSKISNALSCILLVKSYSNEEEELKRFSDSSDNAAKVLIQISKMSRIGLCFQEVASIAFILLLLSVTGVLRSVFGCSITGLLAFFILLKRSMTELRLILEGVSKVAAVKEPAKNILRVFDNRDKSIIKNGNVPFRYLQSGIGINNLHFSYSTVIEALRGVDLFIRKNTMTAIVGSTGSGKSTLINILVRFYDIPDGSVTIDGIDIKAFDIKSLHSKMALIGQDVALFNSSLRMNLLYGANRSISDPELMDICRSAELYDFIEALPNGFETLIGDRGMRLSGGEKQRIAIARAMIKEPEILIFDEATNALDSNTEVKIQKALEKLIAGKTSIFIAHRLSTIKHADNIVVLESGLIVEQGILEELIRNKGVFYKYWEQQKFF